MNTIDETQDLAALPELTDARIDVMEAALFARISDERSAARTAAAATSARHHRRVRTAWWTAGAAAAVVVAAMAIGPTLQTGLLGGVADRGPTGTGESSEVGAGVTSDGLAPGIDSSGVPESDMATRPREIIATANATVRVDDVQVAAKAVEDAAAAQGGFVESMHLGRDGDVVDGVAEGGVDTMPSPTPSGAWITVRVPAAELTGAIDALSALGTVESSSITREDVTAQALDLRARVSSLKTSVERLTDLMADAKSVSDLLAAETALSQRQSELESYEQQLTWLDAQVSMSSLTVTLTTKATPVNADPAGFTDGLAAGWNGLIATMNGIVIGLGFILPWLLVVGVAGLIVWLIVRSRRQRRAARQSGAGPVD